MTLDFFLEHGTQALSVYSAHTERIQASVWNTRSITAIFRFLSVNTIYKPLICVKRHVNEFISVNLISSISAIRISFNRRHVTAKA